MATTPKLKSTSTTADPLAGIPLASAKPAPAVAASPASTGTVVNLAQAKRKRKYTADQYKQSRDIARKATGYDSSSPIWGKRLPEVLMAIEELLVTTQAALGSKDYPTVDVGLDGALNLNRELQKRLATNAAISGMLK